MRIVIQSIYQSPRIRIRRVDSCRQADFIKQELCLLNAMPSRRDNSEIFRNFIPLEFIRLTTEMRISIQALVYVGFNGRCVTQFLQSHQKINESFVVTQFCSNVNNAIYLSFVFSGAS